MTKVMLTPFIRQENPNLDKSVIPKVVEQARTDIANLIFKDNGRWYFDVSDTPLVRAFVTDPAVLLSAEKTTSFFAGGAVKARTMNASNGIVRFGTPAGNVAFDVKDAGSYFNEMSEEIQKLNDEKETLEKALEEAKQKLQQAPSNVVALRPAQAPVRPMTREGIVAALVDILVKNPEIYICSATKTEMGRKLSKMANDAGLRTLNGLKWSHKNLIGYERGIKEQFKRVQKPKVRATCNGVVLFSRPEFAIAAE